MYGNKRIHTTHCCNIWGWWFAFLIPPCRVPWYSIVVNRINEKNPQYIFRSFFLPSFFSYYCVIIQSSIYIIHRKIYFFRKKNDKKKDIFCSTHNTSSYVLDFSFDNKAEINYVFVVVVSFFLSFFLFIFLYVIFVVVVVAVICFSVFVFFFYIFL